MSLMSGISRSMVPSAVGSLRHAAPTPPRRSANTQQVGKYLTELGDYAKGAHTDMSKVAKKHIRRGAPGKPRISEKGRAILATRTEEVSGRVHAMRDGIRKVQGVTSGHDGFVRKASLSLDTASERLDRAVRDLASNDTKPAAIRSAVDGATQALAQVRRDFEQFAADLRVAAERAHARAAMEELVEAPEITAPVPALSSGMGPSFAAPQSNRLLGVVGAAGRYAGYPGHRGDAAAGAALLRAS